MVRFLPKTKYLQLIKGAPKDRLLYRPSFFLKLESNLFETSSMLNIFSVDFLF